MNNKGTTLIEVMISVALIAIIMVFMFTLLVDLKNEESLSTKKSADALNRSAIIHLIQNDIISRGIKTLTFCNDATDVCDANHLYYTFNFQDNTSKKLIAYNNYFVYDNEKWTLSSGKYELSNMQYCFKNDVSSNGVTSPYYYYMLLIHKDNLVSSNGVTSPYYYLRITIPATHDATSRRKYDIDLVEIKNMTGISIPTSVTYLSKNYACN